MRDIQNTKTELLKTYLYLKFDGICGLGSEGNLDVDFIIDETKKNISKYGNVQALIFDFTNMSYTFGNRFLNLFKPNIFKNNKTIFISILIGSANMENWKSLIDYGNLDFDFYGSETSVFQSELKGSIKSINKRMNNKKRPPNNA